MRDRINALILTRASVSLWLLLVNTAAFAVLDLVSGPAGALRIGVLALRSMFAGLTVALLRVTRSPRSIARAVPLTLLSLALATMQAVTLGVVRGGITTRMVLLIAIGAGVSVVVPWGAWAQLAAVTITGLGALALFLTAAGTQDTAFLAYPLMTACAALGMSLYAAYGFRRYFTASVAREAESRRTEAALRASEERSRNHLAQLDALYRTAPVGFSLVDTDLRFVRVNEALADMNGVPIAEHIGRTIREVLPEIADILEPLYRRVIGSGEPIRDLVVSGRTAREPGVTRHWRTGYWPLRAADGEVVGVSCVVEEITEQKRALETMRQNEERLRIVSQATNDAVWDWDLATDALWYNEGMQTLFGHALDDVGVTAAFWYDNIHPQEREEVVAGIHALIDSGQQHWSAEYRFRRADGSYAHVFDRGTVLHGADGKPTRMIGAMIDISKRKRTEAALAKLNAELEDRVRERTEALAAANLRLEAEVAERRQAAEARRESQRQLQDILDNSSAVIYLKDTEGRYLLINLQYEILFHVRREEVRGKTDYDLFPHEAADVFRANDSQVLATNSALTFEEPVPHDAAMHTYISVKFPLRDSAGRPYGVCGISTDITDRKQMEAELRASRAQMAALIEHTSDAIWSIDRQYRVTGFNSVVRRWYSDAHGKPLKLGDAFDVPNAERDYWQRLYDRTLAGDRSLLERDFRLGGALHSYLISMTPILTDGRVTGAAVYARDITELRHAQERLRQHQAELAHVLRVNTMGEMAAGLAHEINQPLGAIANYAQGCRRRLASGLARADELLPAIDEIAAQALRAGEIIRRLRQLVQKSKTPHEAVDLNRMVADAVHVIAPQARHDGVTLSVDLAPEKPRVHGDRIQIEQVILNLMLNGLEAMHATNGAKHELSVRTTLSADGTVEMTVRDTGVGLAASVAEKMFEPFYSSKPSGLGMGLAISRSIVEEHGGRLWATNNSDRGATFHLVLAQAAPGTSAS